MALRTTLYDAERTDREVALTPEMVGGLLSHQLLWVDISEYSEGEVRAAGDVLGLERSLITRLLAYEPRPRLHNHGKHFQFNVQAIEETDGKYRLVELDFVVSDNFILTTHAQPVAFLVDFDAHVHAGSELGQLNAPGFLAALLDWHLTSYFRIVEEIEAKIDRVDAHALRRHHRHDVLADLSRLRQRVAFVRRWITPHREIYSGLVRPDFQLFAEEAAGHYVTLNDRLERAIEEVEHARELLIGSFEIFTTQTALRTDEAMKVFTLASFVWFPASVIVGIAGLLLRAPVDPLHSPGFWVTIASVVGIGLLTWIVARWRRWL